MDVEGVQVAARAPAKINLVLAVGPARADGYHELATIFHALDLYDEVVAYPSEEFSVTVRGLRADRLPTDKTNLAVRAAMALAEYAGVRAGARLDIRKRIPVAGGLAGGSADAAASLVACDALWETGLGRGELATLAARLGSDVPFALAGGTSLGSGRGEQLTAVMVGGTFQWVLAMARGGLATPEVYAEFDRLRTDRSVGRPAVGHDVLTALRAGDPVALGASMHNDLQAAACSLQPSLRATLDTGKDLGAIAGIVSGSGPTCVFLARDKEQAEDLAAGLAASEVCADAWVVTGPAAGARLI
ncbi:MAG TPA: 4-(cytidine 5'-diphospho)-2-C-methyl-D-erythritol kinase [Jiangellaceae bacterium]|nr:4-(cytidine 5'-diphospho)-2-C-methyl-D-erythritol kinase [Jiangellaceae bacterium]